MRIPVLCSWWVAPRDPSVEVEWEHGAPTVLLDGRRVTPQALMATLLVPHGEDLSEAAAIHIVDELERAGYRARTVE